MAKGLPLNFGLGMIKLSNGLIAHDAFISSEKNCMQIITNLDVLDVKKIDDLIVIFWKDKSKTPVFIKPIPIIQSLNSVKKRIGLV